MPRNIGKSKTKNMKHEDKTYTASLRHKASTTETATVVANIVYTDDDTDTERDQKGAERNGITLCIVLRW